MTTSTKPATQTEPLFREEQRFRQRWLQVLLGGLLVFLGYGLFQQLVRGVPFGSNPAPNAVLAGITLLVAGVAAWIAAIRLFVEVRPAALHVRYRGLFVDREIPLADIERAEAVTYSPIKDYGGWGLRYGAKGKAYNVSGDRGVRLTFTDGNALLIGSERAEALAGAIRQGRR